MDSANNISRKSFVDPIFGKQDSETFALMSNFFNHQANRELELYQNLALDLYRAITCYRLYGTTTNFFHHNPELADYREDVEDLWNEFSGLDESELASVAIKLLEDI